MKILNVGNIVNVVTAEGEILSKSFPLAEIPSILSKTEEEIVELFQPRKQEILEKIEKVKGEVKSLEKIIEQASESEYLTYKGNSFYLLDISELSVPIDLVKSILKAEKKGKTNKIKSYLNFWTLCCLNPDSRVRNNLFWFLKKYGITISSSGLFVGYRNVEMYSEGTDVNSDFAKAIATAYCKVKFKWKKNPRKFYLQEDNKTISEITKVEGSIISLHNLYHALSKEEETPTYTDSYSRTFKIKIGVPVTIDRSECDSVQENTCSRGLHVASADWLSSNYFGKIPLMVLCSPSDIVAVPPSDSYGKLRTCRYFPTKVVEFDENDNIIDDILEDGFEDDFYSHILYTGEGDNSEAEKQVLEIPNIPELVGTNIISKLQEAKDSLLNKVYV